MWVDAKRERRWTTRLAAGIVAGLGVGHVRASEPPPSAATPSAPAVRWEAPASCPSPAEVDARIDALLEDRRADVSTTTVAIVTPTADGYRLELTPQGASEASRVLEASDCAELAEATAVLVALSVTEPAPEAGSTTPAAPPREDPAGDPPAPSSAAEPAPAVATPGAEAPTSPEPPRDAGEDEPSDESAARATRPGSDAEAPTDHARTRFTAEADVELGAGFGLWAPTGALRAGGFARWRWFRFGGSLHAWLPTPAVIPGQGDAGGRFGLYGVSADACAAPDASSVRLGLCARLAGGAASGAGIGSALVTRGRATSGWLAGLAGGDVSFALGPRASVGIAGGVLVMLVRPGFRIDGAGRACCDRVGGHVGVRAALRFARAK